MNDDASVFSIDNLFNIIKTLLIKDQITEPIFIGLKRRNNWN